MKKSKPKTSSEPLKNKNNKRKNFMILYGVIIGIILIFILFIAPDSMFNKESSGKTLEDYLPTTEETDKYTAFTTQQEHLENNEYEYKYNISDSDSVNYKCTGTISNTTDTGSCTSPKEKNYTEKNKSKVLSSINLNYLTPSYLFDLIADKEGDLLDYGGTRSYTYNITSSKNLAIEIMIYTDYDEITRITVSTAYEVYDITFSNIKY